MKMHIFASLLLLLTVCTYTYGEEPESSYDYSYLNRFASLNLTLQPVSEVSLKEYKPYTFKLTTENKGSLRERLEGLRPRWTFSTLEKYETTLTLSEDEEKYIRIKVRF